MDLDNFTSQLAGVFRIKACPKISKDTKLKDIKNWDSFCTLAVITFVDINFDENISESEIKKCDTVKSLYEFVQKKKLS